MKKNGNVLHIGITLLVGVVFFVIGQLLYPVFSEKMWPPFGIALYFFLFAIILLAVMFILNQVRRDYSYWIKCNKKETIKKAYLSGTITVVILFILSGVFEFLYELGKVEIFEPTSYVFLIDDSGSMASNDPNFKRSDAINEIMRNESIPYSVYKFTDSATLIKRVGLYSEDDEYDFEADGNTDILGSLVTVINDIINSRNGYGKHPKVLLLSDGNSSKRGLKQVVKMCTDNGVMVSTIGFNVESNMLQNIARKTGGVYLKVDDVSNLQQEMKSAITSVAKRTLISERFMIENNALYGFLRTFFLILLGLIWSWLKYETFCSGKGPKFDNLVFKSSIICCTIAAILMEMMFSLTDLPVWINRLIFCLLWSITPGYFVTDNNYNFVPQYDYNARSDMQYPAQSASDVLIKHSQKKNSMHTLKDVTGGFGFDENNDSAYFRTESGAGMYENSFVSSDEEFGAEPFGNNNIEAGFGDSFGGFGE